MSKFTLGKLHSKYHILDILSYSLPRQEAVSLLQQLSHSFRLLLNENLTLLLQIMPELDIIEISCIGDGGEYVLGMPSEKQLYLTVSAGCPLAIEAYIDWIELRASV